MSEIPTYQRSKVDTSVRYGSGAAGIMQEQANANERLQARLQGGIQRAAELSMPQITKETQEQALKDVKAGKIDSKSVALVAQDVYKKTAEASFYADVEVGAKDLGTKLVNDQTLSGKYDVNAISSSWDNYIKGTTSGIKDIVVKSNIEKRLQRMGQQFQAQVGTLQNTQQRNLQKKNITAKLDMDTQELKKATGVNPERTVELQKEIATNITTLVNANFITPAEAENLHTSINKSAYIDHTQRQFKEALSKGLKSADNFVEKFNKSSQPLLDEKEKLNTINSFKSQMSDLKRDAKNSHTASVKNYTVDVNEAIKILNSGKVPDNKIALDEAVKMLPVKKQRQYQIASTVQSIMSKFSDKSLPEMEAYINSKEAKEVSDIYGIEVLDEAKKVIAKKKKLASSDPLSLAIQDGLFEQPKTVTVSDLTALTDRLSLSAITSSQYGTSPKLLTAAEATAFSDYMENPTVNISAKQSLISQINSYGTEIAEGVYRQVGGKKSYNFAFAGELASSGNTRASTLTLQGRNADITLDADLKIELQQKIKGVFNNYTAEFYNQNLQGLKDHAKGLMITGQDVDADDILENTIGKSVKYNSKQTILPYGVKEGDFENWLDNIEIPNRPALTKGLQNLTDRTFSGDYQLHYAGPGKYLIWNDNNGKGYYAKDTEDPTKPFILKWDK